MSLARGCHSTIEGVCNVSCPDSQRDGRDQEGVGKRPAHYPSSADILARGHEWRGNHEGDDRAPSFDMVRRYIDERRYKDTLTGCVGQYQSRLTSSARLDLSPTSQITTGVAEPGFYVETG